MSDTDSTDVAFNDGDQRPQPRMALTLGGGGARAAYQVGVLRAIAQRYPNLRIPLLTGVSAGAINISHLASHTGPFAEQIDALSELWRRLRLENVFETAGPSLIWRAVRIGMRLMLGLPLGLQGSHGMVDTQPLRLFLRAALHTKDGSLPGIRANIESGRLDAVALTSLSYGTGDTVTFHQGQSLSVWEQPRRRSIETPLTVEHVMASAALPLFFPPVQIDGDWYGDGGIRLVKPLSPALHLGADRILVISNHFMGANQDSRPVNQPPSPATVLSALYNAVFLDQLDQNVAEMELVNRLVGRLPPEERHGKRDIKMLVIRPSEDIGAMAYELRDQLPPTLSHMMRKLGTAEVRSQDFLSTVLFIPTFIERLMQLGERDGKALGPELQEFIEV